MAIAPLLRNPYCSKKLKTHHGTATTTTTTTTSIGSVPTVPAPAPAPAPAPQPAPPPPTALGEAAQTTQRPVLSSVRVPQRSLPLPSSPGRIKDCKRMDTTTTSNTKLKTIDIDRNIDNSHSGSVHPIHHQPPSSPPPIPTPSSTPIISLLDSPMPLLFQNHYSNTGERIGKSVPNNENNPLPSSLRSSTSTTTPIVSLLNSRPPPPPPSIHKHYSAGSRKSMKPANTTPSVTMEPPPPPQPNISLLDSPPPKKYNSNNQGLQEPTGESPCTTTPIISLIDSPPPKNNNNSQGLQERHMVLPTGKSNGSGGRNTNPDRSIYNDSTSTTRSTNENCKTNSTANNTATNCNTFDDDDDDILMADTDFWNQAARAMDVATRTSKDSINTATHLSSNLPQQQQPSVRSAIAELRPDSWTASTAVTAQGHPPQPQPLAANVSHGSSGASSLSSPMSLHDRRASLARALPESLCFDYAKIQETVQDQYSQALIQNAGLSQSLLNGWTLFPHQQEAIRTALARRRQILALDMGLGKTLIGCCWARAFVRTFGKVGNSGINDASLDSEMQHARCTTTVQCAPHPIKVIVLCPVSLKQEWQRTAQEATGLNVQGGKTQQKSGKEKSGKQGNDKKTRKKKGASDKRDCGEVIIASWGKVPIGCGPNGSVAGDSQKYIVIADEAHSMQCMSSARTQDALHLMLSPNAIGVLLLTGTPMKNGKPSNLFPLLRAVQHPLGQDQRAYEVHFCDGRIAQFGGRRPMWQTTGANNLEQLHTLTLSHLLYMTKEDCLQNLPPQTRVTHSIPVSSQSQLRHTAALKALASVYTSANSTASARNSSSNEAVLGAVQNLRRVDSFAKVDATVAVALKVLEKEPAVVIFSCFVDVAKLLHVKLGEAGWAGELLTGETPANKRQGLVDNFQNGLSSVFVCTFGAGGVGLTLTAAATVVLIDRPWTPGEANQAEDRVRRIGQTRPVTSIWVSAFELDTQMDAMLASKNQTASSVLSSTSTTCFNPDAKLSIHKLLQSVLPPP